MIELLLVSAALQEPFRLVRPSIDAATRAYRRSLPEERPPLRGFRAPILGTARERPPFREPGPDADERVRRAADIVGRRLAFDGLLATLVRAIDARGAQDVAASPAPEQMLAEIGLPVDLLAAFELDGVERGARPLVAHVAARLAGGEPVDDVLAALARARFAFEPSGFEVASESGEHAFGALRVQLSRGDPWLGPGDGGNVDLVLQLARELSGVDLLASIEERHLDAFAATVRAEPTDIASRLTVIAEDLPVAQWAQDDGKAGLAAGGIATLVPRYASRGEEGSVFVPGETFLADGLAAAGHRVIQSPLLFQGGNVLAALDPRTGERVLVLGEAEIHRNVALGLTREQALEALRLELGADRCVVLPAASFHVDAEVSLRIHEGELLAFVNDVGPAARIVLGCGVGALQAAGLLAAEESRAAEEALRAGSSDVAIQAIGRALGGQLDASGRFPASVAAALSRSAVDPGAANLHSLFLAVDVELPVDPAQVPDPAAAAYFRSFARLAEDRRAIRAILAENGWRVVPVPSLADGAHSLNYVNALHDRTRCLVPVYGGLWEPLDRAALDAYARALGPDVAVIPIRAGESQRRSGAVHCSVAAYPALDPAGRSR